MSDYNRIDRQELDRYITKGDEDLITGNVKEVYCANCETEATWIIVDTKTPLCETCHTAYEWGQESPGADLMTIEEWGDEIAGNPTCKNCGREEIKKRCHCNSGECTRCMLDDIDEHLALEPDARLCNCGNEHCATCNYYKSIGEFKSRKE